MQKTLRDETIPEDDYRVPDNIRGVIDDIEARAKKTYPDHGESRRAMVRQETLRALSAYAATCSDFGRIVDRQQKTIETQERKLAARPWWQRWFS